VTEEQFLSEPHVKAMVAWVQDKLDSPGSFCHTYTTRRAPGLWSCDSLYGAFEGYHWKFEFTHPDTRRVVKGTSFSETRAALDDLTGVLKQSLNSGDHHGCLAACLSVLQWGGVLLGNEQHLRAMGHRLVPYLKDVASLTLESLDVRSLPQIRVTSGMVKLYSLLVNDLVMYDSRVAAALCLLVRLFCEDVGLPKVPPALGFRQLPHRSSFLRDASQGEYLFNSVGPMEDALYLDSVVKASWLLRSVVRNRPSRFSLLGKGKDLDALQSALFMIGYDLGSGGTGKPTTPSQLVTTAGVCPNPCRQRGHPLPLGPAGGGQLSATSMPPHLLDRIVQSLGPLPRRYRGIAVSRELVRVTLEVLNAAPGRILPQNCRNAVAERTPDGLDRRVKEAMGTDLRTSNIVSDLLQEAGVVEVTGIVNDRTGRIVKATRLCGEWSW